MILRDFQWTDEQLRIIHHAAGRHARVLAVAGSGKSITLAARIEHLIRARQADPGAIQVLMFNALARRQFRAHLSALGLPEELQPEVDTFHSHSYRVIRKLTRKGFLPELTQYWLGDRQELVWLTVKRAITNLERKNRIRPGTVDPERALNAIGLWKGALLPPSRAGAQRFPELQLVYEEFERLRLEKAALTFDDFVPLALELLREQPALVRGCTHLFMDEYQDINYGQQCLIELVAGEHADVMVVGDDDQTIYEWRGARPNYILEDFPEVFKDNPTRDYTLSRSFRFGPAIARRASRLISLNSRRLQKPLVAHFDKPGFVQVYEGGFPATRALAEEVLSLVRVDRVLPEEVAVLARLYAQLDNLQAEFLAREIPFRVDGQEPFFKRGEVNALLDYLRLARGYDGPIGDRTRARLINVANKPSRLLSRALLGALLARAREEDIRLRSSGSRKHA
jgi:DNA helicase-2/ATP-dependent DNA helicase PcrA